MALETALKLNPNLSPAYFEKQNIYYNSRKLQEALEINMAGYKLAKNSHEVELQHRFLNGRGMILKRLGRHQEAQRSIEKALAMAGQIGDRRSEGEYLGNLGTIASSVADYQKALDYYLKALNMAQELGDKQNEVAWLTNMGVVYRNLGQLSEARAHHQQALLLAQEIKDRKWEGLNIGNLGSVYLYLAQYSKALAHYEEALAIHREITVEELQQSILKDNKVLLEYFVAQERIFVWFLTKERLQFHSIDLSRKELQDRLASISPLFQKEKNLADIQIDHRRANLRTDLLHDLYQTLIRDFAEEMLKPGMELIIVPDDILHYFPFEILVTKLGADEVRYLIEDYPISYAASASSLNPELEKVKKSTQKAIGLRQPGFWRRAKQRNYRLG